jgi:hypothetical protein
MAAAAHAYSVIWKDAYPAALVYKVADDGLHTVAWD